MKLFFVIFFFFTVQIVSAQCDDKQVFTELEKENFVQVYLKLKRVKPQSQEVQLFNLAKKYKITPNQFQEIQDRSKTKKPLTTNEKLFVDELRQLQEEYKSELKNITLILCEEQKLNSLDYQYMQGQFKSCMKFQQSLASYFKKWMK